MNKQLIAQLIFIFLITQAIGLWTANFLIQENIKTTIVTDNPDDAENGVALIIWIIFTSAVLIVLIKFAPDWLLGIILKIFESMAIFGTTIIVLLPTRVLDEIILGIATLLVIVRIIFSKNIWLRNISSTIAAAGAGALIGVSLGIFPVLLFIVLLSVYDYIAVFKTKHMVTLAKGVTKKNLSFTYALPTKEHQFELGTGDMVIPLAFAASVLGATSKTIPEPYNFIPSIAILIASLAGLIITLNYASLKTGRALPALPLQTILMLIAFGLAKLAGF
ncbi:MAG TPA: presenilin family intramembrane aspartyl protease [archaeon]|nr:presenilin family intramembrane aspartyl protease [archaeon]